MDLARLEKNLTDNIKEAQLKLGFDDRPMSLNYTSDSLRRLLGAEPTNDVLSQFADFALPRLGKLSFREIKGGICITIPAEGTSYVNNLTGYDFLEELIKTVGRHGIFMADVIAVFKRYSDNAVIEDSKAEDFDILAYFPDKRPDEYFYCLTEEPCIDGGCHVIYHRFIREDFEELFAD
ncbi:MAG: DUF3877 family protein [Ruminococcus sp.]|nr:DUF3877 family protein [Ruminococcus sp.]